MSYKILLIKKKFLSHELAKESLDMALAGTSLDLSISLLFMDDAIFHLMKPVDQSTPTLFEALPFYEIESIYVTEESMQERGVKLQDLVVPVVAIPLSKLADVISQYKVY